MKVVGVIVVSVALLGACGEPAGTPEATADRDRTSYADPLAAPTLSPDVTPAVSNAEALAKGMSLLGSFRWREVGEAEPPHGSRTASLFGATDEHEAFLFVYPDDVPAPEGDVLELREVGGVTVTTVQVTSRPPLLRFRHGDFTIDLQVYRQDSFEPDLAMAEYYVDALLCPSEC